MDYYDINEKLRNKGTTLVKVSIAFCSGIEFEKQNLTREQFNAFCSFVYCCYEEEAGNEAQITYAVAELLKKGSLTWKDINRRDKYTIKETIEEIDMFY